MTRNQVDVIAGVDTHADTDHAALITTTGQHLADREFPTTPDGYARMAGFLASHGRLLRTGVDGTSSYGAGITRVLQATGIEVVEVIRPTRTQRRRGKSDPIDAYAAAAATLTGEYLPIPKQAGGDMDAIRALMTARRSAVKARGDAIRQITSLLVTAPIEVRQRFRRLSDTILIRTLAMTQPGPAITDTTSAVLTALRTLTRRHQQLTSEIGDLEANLGTLVTRTNPALRAAHGVGPVVAAHLLATAGDSPERITNQAAFAALTGTSPTPAPSGRTDKWRLNRGGDRQANSALHQIALVRLSSDPPTRAYAAKKRTEATTTKETLRCLKRAIAREMYSHLTRPQPVPTIDDLRPLRQSRNVSLETAAAHVNRWATDLSRLERGLRRDDQFTKQYRDWLTDQPQA